MFLELAFVCLLKPLCLSKYQVRCHFASCLSFQSIGCEYYVSFSTEVRHLITYESTTQTVQAFVTIFYQKLLFFLAPSLVEQVFISHSDSHTLNF